ncbi:MAG: STAS domain-containing protein [Spirochaetia bacterium]|jgi:anti-anti-sigma factor
MQPPADSILVGSDNRGWFITARGGIRATLCFPLRETLLARLEDSADVPAVYVDLGQCSYMDSTFIGLLVAIDRRLQKGSGGRLHVMQASPECLDLFRQLGLQDFLVFDAAPTPPPPEMKEPAPAPGRPGADFVLHAHEALMDTSEEARRKFGLLREELERKLRDGTPHEDTR